MADVRIVRVVLLMLMLLSLPSCSPVGSLFSAWGRGLLKSEPKSEPSRASGEVRDNQGNKDVLFILALSGGGSRAAYFSSAAMLRLQKVFQEEKIDLLKEVDVISSVSGGSLAGAYYCISRDKEQTTGSMDGDPPQIADRRVWDEYTVKKLMKKNYTLKWAVHWFFPHNIVRYWFTPYTRTDIMAGIFEDDLFDSGWLGRNLTFRDLSPERPYLILNATDATSVEDSEEGAFKLFTFTEEDFQKKLGSNINDFSIGRAVMASAAFPGAFSYVNLREQKAERRFVYLFDGGAHDNLGLGSAEWVAGLNKERYKKLVVILVDSFPVPPGVPAETRDPRWPFGYIIDTNFLATYDSLLTANRKNLVNWFQEKLHNGYAKKDPTFCHITFENICCSGSREELEKNPGRVCDPHQSICSPQLQELQADVNKIPTDFALSNDDANKLDQIAEQLVNKENNCLQEVRKKLLPDGAVAVR